MIITKNTRLTLYFILLLFASCEKQDATVVQYLPFRPTTESTWGLISTNGHILISNAFSRQPSAVVGDVFYVPDSTGLLHLYQLKDLQVPIHKETFIQAGYFFDKVTIAQRNENTPLIVINKQGRTVAILDTYQQHHILMAHNFSQERALIRTSKGKYGYIDEKGTMAIKPIYDCAYDFSDGVAVAGITNSRGETAYQIIDKQGIVICYINLQNSRITAAFSNGLLSYKNLEQERCAYLNKGGSTALTLPGNIQEALSIENGVALFLDENGVGLIDKKGRILIPGSYEQGKILGTGRVAFKRFGKWGLFNFNGKAFSNFIYEDISSFYDGTHAFAYTDSTYIPLNSEGVVSGNCYQQLIIDRKAEQRIPQIFYRYPQKQQDKDTIKNDQEQIPPFKSDREEAQMISQNNPFFEEAQKLLSGKLPETDIERRRIILDYVESFREAYTHKDIHFIEQVFSEDALIVVGKVIKQVPNAENNYMPASQVVYNVKNKKEYITRLKEVFRANKQIRIRFSDFKIMRHPTQSSFYGVTMKQGYSSNLYSDEGYLFLLWDFRDVKVPKIHIRTWQPSMLDEQTPLPIEKIFSIRNFNFE